MNFEFSVGGFDVSSAVLMLGAITGMVYGALGVGLVLVYRSSRVINFAHGDIGAFGAAVLGVLATETSIPYWLVFVFAVAVAAGIGSGASLIIRRLQDAPVVVSVIATLGIGAFLQPFAAVINKSVSLGTAYPQPAGLPTFSIGHLLVTPAYSAMLFMTPVIVLLLAAFLKRSRVGLGIRAAAANADTAQLAGIVPSQMSTVSWAIAGGLAAFTAILVLPSRGFTSANFLGPGLLMRALACAVLARMTSLPVTCAGGIALGVIEALIRANDPGGGMIELAIFIVILGSLLLRREPTGRVQDKGTWATVQAWPPLPDAYRAVFAIRNLGWMVAGGLLTGALVLAAVVTNAVALDLIFIAVFTLVGLSIVIMTSLGGQLSLGQFALGGVGAAVSYLFTRHGGNFIIGVALGSAVAGAVSVAIGLPALRIRGLMLAVTTLGFAIAAQDWLLAQDWMLGNGVKMRRPAIGGTALDTGIKYYFVALAALLIGVWITRNIWRGGIGRRLRAIRDNEDAARAFTVPAIKVKLQGFAVAGCLAGLGGAVYGHLLTSLAPSAFRVENSINSAAVVVLGGMGVLISPLLGAFYIIGVPVFIPLDNAGLAATAAGWFLIVVSFPGGLAQLFAPMRYRLIGFFARRAGLDPIEAGSEGAAGGDAPEFEVTASLPRASGNVPEAGEIVLHAEGLSRRFGGIRAVEDVSLVVKARETVGVIGPNGAGKTTFFELLSGFTRPDEGKVLFRGEDITGFSPERRAQRGLIRSFQDAALFPTLTVIEVLMLSLERVHPTPFIPSVLGSTRADRVKSIRAHELAAMMGLYGYRNHQIRTLSTGTRRIAELACLIALEPTALLLDEPTAGIAQRETEAFGTVLQNVKNELQLTLVVIEHDIPLIMRVSDRIIAMEAGKVLAEGSPESVATDPAVVASYLGTDTVAIERSDRQPDRAAVRSG